MKATDRRMVPHNQARRVSSKIVSFLLDLETLDRIDEICEASAETCRLPLTRSAWIKRAIQRELQHRERGRKSRRRVTDRDAAGVPDLAAVTLEASRSAEDDSKKEGR